MCVKKSFFVIISIFTLLYFLSSCHFIYDSEDSYKSTLPDITMEELEYARVKNGKLVASMEAEIGDRYEDRHVMELKNFNFKQYDISTGNVDALGTGGKAIVELDTGNVQLSDNIRINVESEDLDITTEKFDWKDKSKTLSGPANSPVNIEKSDGTNMRGNGFTADMRTKTWIFSSDVDGIYVYEDEEDDTKKTDITNEKTDTATVSEAAIREVATEQTVQEEQSATSAEDAADSGSVIGSGTDEINSSQ